MVCGNWALWQKNTVFLWFGSNNEKRKLFSVLSVIYWSNTSWSKLIYFQSVTKYLIGKLIQNLRKNPISSFEELWTRGRKRELWNIPNEWGGKSNKVIILGHFWLKWETLFYEDIHVAILVWVKREENTEIDREKGAIQIIRDTILALFFSEG